MSPRVSTLVLCSFILCCSASAGPRKASGPSSGPLSEVSASFPGDVQVKQRGRLIEFCPDGVGPGFLGSKNVSAATLEDFAYLYLYFFSDYYALPKWRKRGDAASTAEQVLSKRAYRGCKKASSRETARCILLDLSRNGRIKLLFIRYDEGQRNAGVEDIAKELLEKKPAGNP